MSTTRKNLDDWKYPKIPINKLYKNNPFSFFASYAIKDFEETITLQADDKFRSLNLLPDSFLKGFIKKKHKFLHMGLVQIAIKPLTRDGLDAPVIVCLRDLRHRRVTNSLLAVVNANLSRGPIYFNCFPGYSVSMADVHRFEPLALYIMSTGISVVLKIRIVCKATVDLRAKYLKEPILGKTTYFRAVSGTPITTQWDEVVQDDGQPTRPGEGLVIMRRSVSSAAAPAGANDNE